MKDVKSQVLSFYDTIKVMRVAILHDYLNQNGGAERVLKALFEIFPDADLYTLIFDENKFPEFKKNLKKTSFLNRKFISDHHRFFIPLMPIFSYLMKPNEKYDLVISSTNGYAKAFRVQGKTHISYCHTPLRYIWSENFLGKGIKKIITTPLLKIFKIWDKKTANNVDVFLANSNFIKEKIKDCYGREVEVIHPPVDDKIFYFDQEINQENFYLMVGRFVPYKRFDVSIQAFNHLGLKLKIIGRGALENKFKKMAGKNIEILPYQSDEKLKEFYNQAKALIFPQEEDFGLVAAEAQSCGLPVIGYRVGGALEIVEEGKTGIFFNSQDPVSLGKAVLDFKSEKFDRAYVAHRAKRFSKDVFKDKIKEIINERCSS